MKTVQVNIPNHSYPIYMGKESRSQLSSLIKKLSGVHQCVLIVDETVARLHINKIIGLFDRPRVLHVAPGESSKSLAVASQLYEKLAEARMERGDLIITFGGGMVGDLGGFVAATWLRGVRVIQIPTTLEAAIDASIGGKTAVNHPAGKNLIGAFHQPSAVVIDIEFLDTLPQRDFAAGLAESVKHAAIRDPSFFDWHEANAAQIVARGPGDADTLVELIERNCAIKADVVARDERERDLRAILNYGHTIGHALEHVFEYELRHGECVGLGMLVENELACARGLLDRATADRVRALLAALGLPTRLPSTAPLDEVLAACRMDKKARGGAVHFVLLPALGETMRVSDLTDAEIAAAMGVIAAAADSRNKP